MPRIVPAVLVVMILSTACRGGETPDIARACAADLRVVQEFTELVSSLPAEGSGEGSRDGLRRNFQRHVEPALQDLEEAAPDTVRPAVGRVASTYRRFATTGDDAVLAANEFKQATSETDSYFYANCPGNKHSVEAVDFGFQDLPPEISQGGTRFRLRNSGQEVHELAVLSRKEGVPENFDDILSLPQEQIAEKTTFVAAGEALPGRTAYITAAALPAGDYLVVCFVPRGTKGMDAMGDGPPHHALGMKQQVRVS